MKRPSKGSGRTERSAPAFAPKQGERWSDSYFSGDPSGEFGYYGSAFLRSARTLVRSIKRRGAVLRSEHIPVIFLYRHAIELLAKAVIIAGDRLMSLAGDQQGTEAIFQGFGRSKHRLTPLLPLIEKAFKYAQWEWFWPRSRVEDFLDVRRIFAELEKLDADSYAFRYPTDLKGKANPSARLPIGLRTTVSVLDDLAEALETAVFGLEAEYSKP